MVFELENEYMTGDEIEVLAKAFGDLSEQSRGYIAEIVHISAEKERIATELNVAAKIQADMLPAEFPMFPDRDEFELYASMDPAKEVGGDFYDVFLTDDDHLAIVMGDVSDKGVPAALFMVITQTLIRTRAQMGGDPEATDKDEECFGEDRMLETLNRDRYHTKGAAAYGTCRCGCVCG